METYLLQERKEGRTPRLTAAPVAAEWHSCDNESVHGSPGYILYDDEASGASREFTTSRVIGGSMTRVLTLWRCSAVQYH